MVLIMVGRGPPPYAFVAFAPEAKSKQSALEASAKTEPFIMRSILLVTALLLVLPMVGCTSPAITEATPDGMVIRHVAAADDASSLQAQADAECRKYQKKAKFERYADETLLGPRNAYFSCVSP
jgi:hypothetical protein